MSLISKVTCSAAEAINCSVQQVLTRVFSQWGFNVLRRKRCSWRYHPGLCPSRGMPALWGWQKPPPHSFNPKQPPQKSEAQTPARVGVGEEGAVITRYIGIPDMEFQTWQLCPGQTNHGALAQLCLCAEVFCCCCWELWPRQMARIDEALPEDCPLGIITV